MNICRLVTFYTFSNNNSWIKIIALKIFNHLLISSHSESQCLCSIVGWRSLFETWRMLKRKLVNIVRKIDLVSSDTARWLTNEELVKKINCFKWHVKERKSKNSIWNGYTIASKINGTPKGVYLPISKLHSILAVANLLAHNNISQICYSSQISLQSAAVNCTFSDIFGGNIYFAGDGTFKNNVSKLNFVLQVPVVPPCSERERRVAPCWPQTGLPGPFPGPEGVR